MNRFDQLAASEFALNRFAWYLELPPNSPVGITSKARDAWNLSVQELLKNKKFRAIAERMINLELSEQILKNALVSSNAQAAKMFHRVDFQLNCLYSLSSTQRFLTVSQFEKELQSVEKDAMVEMLQDLSALEICLIVAMQHHSDIYDNSPMNFEMLYTSYVKFAHKHSSMQNVQRQVVMKAFEHIEVNLSGHILQSHINFPLGHRTNRDAYSTRQRQATERVSVLQTVSDAGTDFGSDWQNAGTSH